MRRRAVAPRLLFLVGGAADAGAPSGAEALAAGAAEALALDFTDDFYQASTGLYGSAYVLDTSTPANNYDSHPYGLLAYTSPSAKMTMGPSGSLRFGAHNLVTHTADGSQWTAVRTNVSTTNGVSDPNGGTSAITITATGATARIVHGVSVPFASAGNPAYRFTVYIRRRTGTGTVNWEKNDVGVGAEITGLTSSWQQFTYPSDLVASTTWYMGFRLATSGDAIDIAFPCLRRTPSDDTYLAATSVAKYALPYEWVGGTPKLRPEWTATTELTLYNCDFTNAAWTKSSMSTAKTATGPDGVANSATTLTASGANATALQAITSASAARRTGTWIKRRAGSGIVELTQDGGSTWTAVTVTSEWTKVDIPSVTSANPTVGIRVVTSGDAVDVALFAHRTEAILSSDIPTFGATVARAADNITLAQSAFPWNGGAGTLEIDGVISTPDTSGSDLQIKPRSGQTHIETMLWVPS